MAPSSLDLQLLVLVEASRHTHPITVEVIQVLADTVPLPPPDDGELRRGR